MILFLITYLRNCTKINLGLIFQDYFGVEYFDEGTPNASMKMEEVCNYEHFFLLLLLFILFIITLLITVSQFSG